MAAEQDQSRSPDVTETAPLSRSFFGSPTCENLDELEAQVAFLGVPYDLGSPVPGARFGPNGVRDERTRLYRLGEDGKPEGYYDIDADRLLLTGVTMTDCGNVTIDPADIEGNLRRITRVTRAIVSRGSLPVIVGGDQSVTASAVGGFDSYRALDIVHFDAHLDFHPQPPGSRPISSAAIRRCAEFGYVRDITQIGIRATRPGVVAPPGRGSVDDARARGNRIVSADRFRSEGPDAAIATVPESDALYVTIDMDVLDPSVCAGVIAPEPGGLGYLELRAALRALARRGRIVGLDIVGVAPRLDPTGITCTTASQLIIDALTAIFET